MFHLSRLALPVSSVAFVAYAVGCSTPLANRSARSIPVGQVEVSGSVDLFGAVVPSGTSAGAVPIPPILPNLELSGRFGVAKNVDLQLRLDTYVYPEVAIGYQFLGDQLNADDIAASVVVGGRFFTSALGTSVDGNLSVPLMVMVDVPLGVATLTLTSRNIVGVLVGQGGSLTVSPGASAALSFPFGDSPLFLRTEFGANYPILLSGDTNLIGGTNNVAFYGGSIGVGYTFGSPKTATSTTTTTTPAPEPAP